MFWLPTGFDRADGVTPLPSQPKGSGGGGQVVGSPTPTDAVLISSNSNDGETITTEEMPDSPEIERAEQATFLHRFRTSWDAALGYIVGLGRGTFLQDSFGNVWRILNSHIQHLKGTAAEVSIAAESISFDSPPDEFQCVPVELGIDIIKHPRYSWALSPIASDNTTSVTVGDTAIFYTDIKQSIVRAIQSYRDSPFYPNADNVNGLIQNNVLSQIRNGKLNVYYPNTAFAAGADTVDPVPWDGLTAHKPTVNCVYFIVTVPVDLANPDDPITIAIAAAKEIISKLWRQEDTPYMTGYEITWSQYFFAPYFLNPGAYIENPVGIVPDYFLSPSQDGSDTIFDKFGTDNPQDYSNDGTSDGDVTISWLRKADEVDFQRTWFKVTHKWIGSPFGFWDSDLYTDQAGPQNANDFNQPGPNRP